MTTYVGIEQIWLKHFKQNSKLNQQLSWTTHHLNLR